MSKKDSPLSTRAVSLPREHALSHTTWTLVSTHKSQSNHKLCSSSWDNSNSRHHYSSPPSTRRLPQQQPPQPPESPPGWKARRAWTRSLGSTAMCMMMASIPSHTSTRPGHWPSSCACKSQRCGKKGVNLRFRNDAVLRVCNSQNQHPDNKNHHPDGHQARFYNRRAFLRLSGPCTIPYHAKRGRVPHPSHMLSARTPATSYSPSSLPTHKTAILFLAGRKIAREPATGRCATVRLIRLKALRAVAHTQARKSGDTDRALRWVKKVGLTHGPCMKRDCLNNAGAWNEQWFCRRPSNGPIISHFVTRHWFLGAKTRRQ